MGEKERIETLSLKINRLIDERNAIQKVINVLDEQRNRLEKPAVNQYEIIRRVK